jgi:hypothetical protein
VRIKDHLIMDVNFEDGDICNVTMILSTLPPWCRQIDIEQIQMFKSIGQKGAAGSNTVKLHVSNGSEGYKFNPKQQMEILDKLNAAMKDFGIDYKNSFQHSICQAANSWSE